MKLARFQHDGENRYGIVEGNTIYELEGDIKSFSSQGDSIKKTGREYGVLEVKILAPSEPSKIICLGLNYRSHAEEMGLSLPLNPILFMKPSTSVIAHGENIVYPLQSRRVDYEAELCVVIGKTASGVDSSHALEYVLGYTCANDVTARDLQPKEGQWTYAKGFDTFCPLGPWIETEIEDPEKLEVKGYLNGIQVQSVTTSDHIFSVREIISFVSSCMTLLPGDVIMTGTPSGIGPMKPGDTFDVEISGLEKLSNNVTEKQIMEK